MEHRGGQVVVRPALSDGRGINGAHNIWFDHFLYYFYSFYLLLVSLKIN
jgi:hypothetical protein